MAESSGDEEGKTSQNLSFTGMKLNSFVQQTLTQDTTRLQQNIMIILSSPGIFNQADILHCIAVHYSLNYKC